MPNPFESLLGLEHVAKDSAHFEAVGRFITAYAAAEAAVHVLARKLSGLADDKARIIFGGLRLPDVIDRVRAMMRRDGVDDITYANVDDCLTQLNAIADRRHKLVHRPSTFLDGELYVTNLLTAKSRESFETDIFDPDEMQNMQWDCSVIYLRLVGVAHPQTRDALDEMKEVLSQPWRYTPAHARPKSQSKQRQKDPGSQKHPPDASGA